MSEVARFQPSSESYLLISPAGDYVEYEDYAALQQKLNAVLAENVALKAAIKDAHKCAEECEFNGEFCYVVPSCELEALGDCLDETPDTDAILNEVRAGVVTALHKEQLEWALVTWQYNNFDALKRAALRYGDSELSGVIFMLDRIEGFAAQLRAGSTEGGV